MPFRFFDPKLMPKSAKSTFRINWIPIFSIMDRVVVDCKIEHEFSSHDVDRLYAEGTDILKTRASYCFQNSNHRLWTVSTWSRKVSASFIEKYGTEQDKLALPPPKNNFSRKSRTSKGRKRQLKVNNTHPRRNENDPLSSSNEETSPRPLSNENGQGAPAGGVPRSPDSVQTPPAPPQRETRQLISSPCRSPPCRTPPLRISPCRRTTSVAATAPPQPLTEEEKQRVIAAARKDTLEESVTFMVRHLMARWKESDDPEPTPINEEEELALRQMNLTNSTR